MDVGGRQVAIASTAASGRSMRRGALLARLAAFRLLVCILGEPREAPFSFVLNTAKHFDLTQLSPHHGRRWNTLLNLRSINFHLHRQCPCTEVVRLMRECRSGSPCVCELRGKLAQKLAIISHAFRGMHASRMLSVDACTVRMHRLGFCLSMRG